MTSNRLSRSVTDPIGWANYSVISAPLARGDGPSLYILLGSLTKLTRAAR